MEVKITEENNTTYTLSLDFDMAPFVEAIIQGNSISIKISPFYSNEKLFTSRAKPVNGEDWIHWLKKELDLANPTESEDN